MSKPLVIKVKPGSVPPGNLGRWADLSGTIKKFTDDIITPAVDENSDISAQVSGIPTAYARANLFNSALEVYGKSTEGGEQNISTFYALLNSEWRGLIAGIALDYSRMKVERVYLQYSDGLDIAHTANIYEPLGTFGNMLFKRKPLWCEKDEQTDEKHRGVPFLEVIKYDGQVIGATSPNSLLFTSCGYKVTQTENRPWIDFQTGRFRDPLESKTLSQTQTFDLYAYVDYLIEGNNNDGKTGINGLTAYFSHIQPNTRPKYDNIIGQLVEWRKQIEVYANSKNWKLEAASIPPINLFLPPFDIVFNYKDEVYAENGVLYGAEADGRILANPKDLLLPDTDRIARIIVKGDYRDTTKLPVYALAADVKDEPGEKAYFALPLSPLGIKAFGKNIGALVEPLTTKANVPSRLTAVFDPDAEKNNLTVTLHLEFNDGRIKELKATYTIGGEIDGKNLILWPNFISRRWHRYFLYSELPHNVNLRDYPFQALPFVGDELHEFSTIEDEKTGLPLYLAEDGHDVDYDFKDPDGTPRHVETSIHIACSSAVADNPYKYEIYECNHPFKGLKLNLPDGKDAGFLLIKYTTTADNPCIAKNKLGIQDGGLRGTRIGVDFGSTNTSIAYSDPIDEQAKGLQFENRRISLLRPEKSFDDVADENALFFFQANPLLSNSIKSTLTLHDANRVTKDEKETTALSKYEKEVKGGFPCFSRNLPIDQVDQRFIRLKGGQCGLIEQAYNMKWDDDDKNIAYKKAFLRSLLLQVYAELFDKGLYPNKLKWSYPSAMSDSLLLKYNEVWRSLEDVNPLNDVNNHAAVDKNPALQLNISQFVPNLAVGGGAGIGGGLGGGNALLGGGNTLLGGGNGLLGGGLGTPAGLGSDNGLLASMTGTSLNASKEAPQYFEKDDDTKPVKFDPVKTVDKYQFQSMTEACAVANYISSADSEVLTLCFDIGGTTTDISAICRLQTSQGVQPTMIKQNSVHFAAQLVSQAVGYCPKFKNVLLSMCEQFNLHIEGLNLGKERYSSATASYYFEQMVDRLSANELPSFYRKIGADCKELLWVDTYVTGLILYYAGILVRKLIMQVRNSPECCWFEAKKPHVNICFAGKGARIMEWLGIATSQELASQYYQAMFIQGMGGLQEANSFVSALTIRQPESSDDVKFEVSKGLAKDASQLMSPKDDAPIEVIGEDGFTVLNKEGQRITLDADNSITAAMMSSLGDKFYGASKAGNRFRDFLGIFLQVAQQYFGMNINPNALQAALESMDLLTFIHGTPEYLHAEKAKAFDFVSPILILEGVKFYQDFLLKNIGRK